VEQARRRIERCKRSRRWSIVRRRQPGAYRRVLLPRQRRRGRSNRPRGDPVRNAAPAFQRGETGQPFAISRLLRSGGFLLTARGFHFVTGATRFFGASVGGFTASAVPASFTTFDLVAQAGRVPAFLFRPLRIGRRLDVVGPRPGPMLSWAEAATIRPTLLWRCATARVVLTRKGLAAVLGGATWQREPSGSRRVADKGQTGSYPLRPRPFRRLPLRCRHRSEAPVAYAHAVRDMIVCGQSSRSKWRGPRRI